MRGYSLVECVVGIALSGLVSIILARSVLTSRESLSAQSSAIEQRISMTKAALVTHAALGALERARIPGLVSISNGNAPATRVGSPHPVSGLSITSRPRPDSDILSFLTIDPRYRGRITKSEWNGTSLSIEACELPELPRADQFRSFLAFGLHGGCQFVGTPVHITSRCISLSGTMIRGVVNDAPCPAASLLELLPISREFSLFIDRSGELRLVSHVGTRIIENQPIVRGLRSLSIHERALSHGATLFDLTIQATGGAQLRFLLPAALAREALWNEVLL